MKDKLLTLYINVFLIFTFFSSAFYVYDWLNKLNIPSGILHIIIYYGYFLLHIASFIAMFHYKDKLITTKKRE